MEGEESSKRVKIESVSEKHKDSPKQFTLKVSCTENFHRYKPTRGEKQSFRLPTILGYFSINENREFQNDDRQRKFIVVPKNKSVAWNLNKGYDSAIRKEQKLTRNEKLNSLLHYILANRDHVIKSFSSGEKPSSRIGFGANFVCYRGLLTNLLTTINKSADNWLIAATKFNGTIYLCEFLTDSKRRELENTTPLQDRMTYWGFKFETYMTTDDLEKPPDVEAVLNENLEFCIAYKGGVGNHRLLYGAEVDGIDSDCADKKKSPKFLELKTSKIISSDRDDWTFRKHKLCKWWAQSYTVNIPTIICGFRDQDGIVRRLEEFDTQSLPEKSQGVWDPMKAIKFCEDFLTFVEAHVKKDDPNVVYKMFWERGKDVTLEELTPPHEYQILPDWYISAWKDVQPSL